MDSCWGISFSTDVYANEYTDMDIEIGIDTSMDVKIYKHRNVLIYI